MPDRASTAGADARPDGRAWTGLVVPAEPVPRGVASFRRRHIHHPGAAVPLHTTVATPFLPLSDIDEAVLARLRAAAARVPSFDYLAGAICAFPTTSVLWLAPSPARPFEEVVDAIRAAFPEVEPAGAYPTFHLTLAMGGGDAEMAAALGDFREGVEARLPFRFRADRLDLYAEVGSGFRRLARVPFAP